ncbi:hypothetical protein [Xenorhabdus szentirmaii]|uniref:Uncharacterized protein n=1 Tax=Xenorhabdus szentirmaii DSM 16338 TaxID=1427518 RepID=W1ITY8_9GAMM|nr:hypothetical protein [Xenorhabdus szentirmaii]PHM30607.1 hypothetical protein Xsze_04198 [Xenorhabdus szentirmaii DSM 16338]CDL81086.1 hypothetical protein XSR1_100128 [Xenorhabdus szentirmaii DSM 16338]
MYELKVKESVTNLPEGVDKSLCPTNAFRIHCDTTGNLQSYTLCQHIVKAKKEKRLGRAGMFKECTYALDNVACPALLMMLTEYKASRIMFYDHYDPSIENYPDRPMAPQINYINLPPSLRVSGNDKYG